MSDQGWVGKNLFAKARALPSSSEIQESPTRKSPMRSHEVLKGSPKYHGILRGLSVLFISALGVENVN